MRELCSLRQLARHLHLAPSTVSMALNGHPSIAPHTRQRIQQAAEHLGYRPNPALAALMSRRPGKPRAQAGLLPMALVVDIPPECRMPKPEEDTYFRILQIHAASFGFAPALYNLSDYSGPAELDRILFARGVQAIALGFWFTREPRVLQMKLDRYAVVGLGDLACDLPMLSIRVSMVESIRLMWRRLQGIQARRILFALRMEPLLVRKDYEMLGAVKALQALDKGPWQLRVHIGWKGDKEAARFHAAVAKWQPDVCVGYNRFHYDELREMGLRIPQDIRYAQLHVASYHEYQPEGVRAPHEATALRALEEIYRLLRSGTLGLRSGPGEILLEPEWVTGVTLPASPVSGNGRKPSTAAGSGGGII